jgi:membrane fusion protein (multidrug efflux system)
MQQTHTSSPARPAALFTTVLAAATLGAVVLAGCSAQADGKAPAAAPPATVTVQVLQPQRQTLQAELVGRATAPVLAEIRPQIGGLIRKRLFTEGAFVKAGQLLYEIDPAPYQAAEASAAATLAKAKATLAAAKLKAERQTELLKIEAVSRQDQEDADAARQQAQAEVAAAEAALQTARINLAYTRITAPISGRIATSAVSPGALVTAGQSTALTTVQQFDPVYVDVTQSSADLLRLQADRKAGRLKAEGAGARVQVFLEDGSRHPRDGTLSFAGVSVDATTGAVTLRAVVPNPDGSLLPGMYVRAVLDQGVRDDALLVPQRSVSRNPQGEASALVVNADGQVEKRTLQVDRAVGNQWLVSGGLAAGDRVITEGLMKVRAGDKVQVEVAKTDASQAKPQAAASAPADRVATR